MIPPAFATSSLASTDSTFETICDARFSFVSSSIAVAPFVPSSFAVSDSRSVSSFLDVGTRPLLLALATSSVRREYLENRSPAGFSGDAARVVPEVLPAARRAYAI